MPYVKFWIQIGAETFQLAQAVLIAGAEDLGLQVEFLPIGDKILDLGVKLTGDLSNAPDYVDWLADILYLYRR